MTRPVGENLEAEQLDDIRRALAGIAERAEQYETAREFDSADLWEADEDTRQGRLLRQAGVDFDTNYSSPIINAIANGLVVDGIVATRDAELAEDGQPVPDERATALVNACWEAQQLGEFYPTWQRNGVRDGDAYLMLWPVAGAELETVEDEDQNGRFVRRELTPEQLNITYCDPLTGRLFYDEENPRVKKYYAYCWTVPAKGDAVIWRMNLIYPEYVDRFVTGPMRNQNPKAEDFGWFDPEDVDDLVDDPSALDDEAMQPGRISNPLGVVPVWHLRTDVNYGRPIHENAYAAQQGISEIIEKMQVTMNFQAWPQAYAIQEAEKLANTLIREDPLADEYHDGLGDFDDGDDRDSVRSDSTITNETGTDLEATPGGMMLLKGFKSVGQLQAADPTTFLEPWREFAKAASDCCGVPPWTFRAVGAEIPSGVALRIASEPQTATRRRCSTLFGSQLGDLLAFAAELCGIPDLTVKIKWAPFETIDETERWTLVKLRTDAGVPLEQALIMAGIPALDARKWAEQSKVDKEEEFQRQQTLASAKSAPGDKDKPEPPSAQ